MEFPISRTVCFDLPFGQLYAQVTINGFDDVGNYTGTLTRYTHSPDGVQNVLASALFYGRMPAPVAVRPDVAPQSPEASGQTDTTAQPAPASPASEEALAALVEHGTKLLGNLADALKKATPSGE